MKPLAVLGLVTVLGLGGAYLAVESVRGSSVAPQAQEEISPIERARRATVRIGLPDYDNAGSAILVGRKRLNDGQYRYRALTAHHVIRNMARDIINNAPSLSKTMNLMFQPTLHGQPVRYTVDINNIDWSVPGYDWASFTFDSIEKFECVPIATREEFESIGLFDKIYAVGYSGGYGSFLREGNIGSTHNQHYYVDQQTTQGRSPWDKHPDKYFRPYIDIWYGDSGGGIYSEDGKLIGIIHGFGIMNGFMPVTHMCIAFKTYFITEINKLSSENLFIVEK